MFKYATAMGAKVIVTSSSDEKLQIAKKLGASELINVSDLGEENIFSGGFKNFKTCFLLDLVLNPLNHPSDMQFRSKFCNAKSKNFFSTRPTPPGQTKSYVSQMAKALISLPM
jgi:D-arabinose 1-dehydrogenase-like Zn-dependent alcohol dehydrogenase